MLIQGIFYGFGASVNPPGLKTLAQITADPVDGSLYPTLDTTGNLIAFPSRADLTGNNPDGSREVFSAICGLFLDGFENGNTTAWSNALP